MALPSGITTCTLTLGADVDPSGDEVAARWTITPVVLRGGQSEPVKLVHATTGVAIIPIPEVVTVGPGGTATIVLPRTSDANIVDAATNLKADWVYVAECRWQRGRGQDSDFTARKAFRLTAATADFDLVAPVELVPASTPIMTVAPHDHSSVYPSRTEMNNLINGITGVDVSGVITWRGVLADGSSVDDLRGRGWWHVYSTNTSPNIGGRPPVDHGFLLQSWELSSGNQLQVALTTSTPLQEQWTRWRGSVGWTNWRRSDAHSAIAEAAAYTDAVAATMPRTAGTKRVPVTLTAGQGATTYSNTTGAVRIPITPGGEILRLRVHIRHHNPRFTTNYPGAIPITGLWLGAHASNGAWAGTPVQVQAAFNTPADGSEWVSGWIEYPMAAGSSHLIAFGWTASAATQAVSGGGWYTSAPANAPAGGTWTRRTTQPLDVWLEVETPSTTPVIAALGSSGAAGVGTNLPVHDSWASELARQVGGLAMHLAHGGTTAAVWNDPTNHKWTRWQHLDKPDAVLVSGLGSNDLLDGVPLATVQTDLVTILGIAASKLAPAIHYVTLTPRDGITGTPEIDRRTLNTWLTTRPEIRCVHNIIPAVSPDDENLTASMTSDGIHLNNTGRQAALARISQPLPTGVATQVTALADATGVRTLTLTPSMMTGGTLTVQRTGNVCVLHADGMTMNTTTGGAVFTLPVGWRPAATRSSSFAGLSSRAQVTQFGFVQFYNWTAGTRIDGTLTWITTDPLPAT